MKGEYEDGVGARERRASEFWLRKELTSAAPTLGKNLRVWEVTMRRAILVLFCSVLGIILAGEALPQQVSGRPEVSTKEVVIAVRVLNTEEVSYWNGRGSCLGVPPPAQRRNSFTETARSSQRRHP